MNLSSTKITKTKFKPSSCSYAAGAVAAALMLTTSVTFAQITVVEAFDDDASNYEEYIVEVLTKGSIQQAQQLFDEGLGIDQNIESDGTPLIIALQNRHHELVEYLIEQGADANLESTQDGNPLIAAALANDLTMVKYIHAQGADIDAITLYDETALISASRAGHFSVVKYLVENGANVNLGVDANVRLGKEWRTPLNGARTEEIRDFLIANGAKM